MQDAKFADLRSGCHVGGMEAGASSVGMWEQLWTFGTSWDKLLLQLQNFPQNAFLKQFKTSSAITKMFGIKLKVLLLASQ